MLGLALMLCVLTASMGDYVRELSIRLSTEVATFARVVGAGDATQLGELKASILSAVAGYPQYDLVRADWGDGEQRWGWRWRVSCVQLQCVDCQPHHRRRCTWTARGWV